MEKTFPTVEVGEAWLQEPHLFTVSRQQPLLLPYFKGAIPSFASTHSPQALAWSDGYRIGKEYFWTNLF